MLVNKDNIYLIKWVIGIIVFILGITTIMFIGEPKDKTTHIEQVIRQHNSIKESLANPKYPTINKPSSSQSTVWGGDSIRIIAK